mgnify:CR=1 FL=1
MTVNDKTCNVYNTYPNRSGKETEKYAVKPTYTGKKLMGLTNKGDSILLCSSL